MLPGKKYGPEDFVRIAWRWKWLLASALVVAAAGSWVYAHSLPNLYRSDASILVIPQRVAEGYVKSTTTFRIEDRLPSMQQQLTSRARLEQLIRDLNLYAGARKTQTMAAVVDRMRGDISMQVVRGDAFRVGYVSDDASKAVKVVERLVSEIIDESLHDRTSLAENTTDFLESQLDDARRRLRESEEKLAEYERTHAGELPSERQSNLQAQQNAEMQVQAIVESINRDRDREFLLQRQIYDLNSDAAHVSAPPPSAVADPSSLLAGTAAQRLEAARAQLRMLEMQFTSEHPEVIRMKRLVRDLEAKAQAEAADPSSRQTPAVMTAEERARQSKLRDLQAELAGLERQIIGKQNDEQRLRGIAAMYQRRLEGIPTSETELTSLKRDHDTLQATYQSLLAKQEDSKIAANLERRQSGDQFRTIDPPRLPDKPFSPRRRIIVLVGALAGLVFGVGIVGLVEYTDNSLKTDDEVTRVLGLSVIAAIPDLEHEAPAGKDGSKRRPAKAVRALNVAAKQTRTFMSNVLLP